MVPTSGPAGVPPAKVRLPWPTTTGEAMPRTGPDDDAPLPIGLGPCSNGEFVPAPPSPVVHETVRRARARADRSARRLGIDRRRFLQSLCGAATVLLLLDACSKEESATRGEEPGGGYRVPSTATEDPDAARDVLGGDEVVFDVQTHLLDGDILRAGGVFFAGGYPQALTCDDDDRRDCFSLHHYLEELFVRSDTTMAVVSAIPIPGAANTLPTSFMEETRRAVDRLCGDGRILIHGLALPQLSSVAEHTDEMRTLDAAHDLAAWKTYTHLPGPGWWLDDRDPGLPQVGEGLLAAGRGVVDPDPVRPQGPQPRGAGRVGVARRRRTGCGRAPGGVARRLPLGLRHGAPEGPYTPETADVGVDRLVRSLREAGIEPGSNVYAELGSTWWNLMRDPTRPRTCSGKLLRPSARTTSCGAPTPSGSGRPRTRSRRFGPSRSPSGSRSEHGYPPLTARVKRKILGENVLRLYGVEPDRGTLRDLTGPTWEAAGGPPDP